LNIHQNKLVLNERETLQAYAQEKMLQRQQLFISL